MNNAASIAILSLTLLLLTSCSTSKQIAEKNTSADTSSTGEVLVKPSEDSEPQTEEDDGIKRSYFDMKKPFVLGDIEYAVDSAKLTRKIGSNQYLSKSAAEGEQYLVVTYKAKNVGNITKQITTGNLAILLPDKTVYAVDSEAQTTMAMDKGESLIFTQMQPNIAKTMHAVFTIPNGKPVKDCIFCAAVLPPGPQEFVYVSLR